jgi:hypothetical protein
MPTPQRLVTAVFVGLVTLGPAASQAFAVSVRDLIELTREGVTDAVLVALIETDGSRFTLNADAIRDLRNQGLSDTVIVAMIRTARPARDNPHPVKAAPPVETDDRESPVASPARTESRRPVVVEQHVTQQVEVRTTREVERPVYVPVYVAVPTRPVEVKKEEPVYWGWGGKRRPDAWPEPVIIKK